MYHLSVSKPFFFFIISSQGAVLDILPSSCCPLSPWYFDITGTLHICLCTVTLWRATKHTIDEGFFNPAKNQFALPLRWWYPHWEYLMCVFWVDAPGEEEEKLCYAWVVTSISWVSQRGQYGYYFVRLSRMEH